MLSVDPLHGSVDVSAPRPVDSASAPRDAAGVGRRVGDGAAPRAPEPRDSLILSDAVRRVLSDQVEPDARVQGLAERVRDGTYVVPLTKLARAIANVVVNRAAEASSGDD
jgi:anti-sigma28 factor (negative regulator of flagellin synthesis)